MPLARAGFPARPARARARRRFFGDVELEVERLDQHAHPSDPPTMAPISASVMAVLTPAKMNGSRAGAPRAFPRAARECPRHAPGRACAPRYSHACATTASG